MVLKEKRAFEMFLIPVPEPVGHVIKKPVTHIPGTFTTAASNSEKNVQLSGIIF